MSVKRNFYSKPLGFYGLNKANSIPKSEFFSKYRKDENDIPTKSTWNKNEKFMCEKCLKLNISINKTKCKKHKQLKAGAIILDKSRQFILLIKGNYANKWNVPKGTSDDNESIRNTAIREIKEETGVVVSISKYEIPVKIYKVFLYVTIVNINCKIRPLDTHEIQDAKWFRISELDKLEDKTTLLKKVMNYLSINNIPLHIG
jgi:8-oxo-dGTP pyrophosphatase MutT (NUDIX family)